VRTLSVVWGCLLLAGCTGEDLLSPTFQVCTPGAEQGCPCHDADDGLQECADHGRSWLRCRCDEGGDEGEGEGGGDEGEGEGGELTTADLAGVWHLRATDVDLVDEDIAVVKGTFELDDDGVIVAGRFWANSGAMGGNPDTYVLLGDARNGTFEVIDAEARSARTSFTVSVGVVTGTGTVSPSVGSITGTYTTGFDTSGSFDAYRYPASEDGWQCHPHFRGPGDGCDCGCGDDDEGCRGGCSEPGCVEDGCVFCYDRQGMARVCEG